MREVMNKRWVGLREQGNKQHDVKPSLIRFRSITLGGGGNVGERKKWWGTSGKRKKQQEKLVNKRGR
jgi:hypothetical protein